MAKILVSGAFGNVGQSTVPALLGQGHRVVILEAECRRSRSLARRLLPRWKDLGGCELILGDIRSEAVVGEAVRGVQALVHLAAIIPPAADRDPALARSVNVGGTAMLLGACQAEAERGGSVPRFVLASSVATYGDRLEDYWISCRDRQVPSPADEYGRTKVEAEALVRASGLPYSILRLGAVLWRKKLDPDPLLFSMPLATRIEFCHTEDCGRAFAAAALSPAALDRTFDIGGGESCRSSYRDFLDRMFRLLGLGGIGGMPEGAFASSGFHCGYFADSDEAESLLGFRSKSLDDYYAEVREEAFWIRLGASLARPWARARLLAASPFLAAG